MVEIWSDKSLILILLGLIFCLAALHTLQGAVSLPRLDIHPVPATSPCLGWSGRPADREQDRPRLCRAAGACQGHGQQVDRIVGDRLDILAFGYLSKPTFRQFVTL